MENLLSVYDYVAFGLMLAVSTCIGLFHAFTGGKQKTQKEYLMANRQMGVLPAALSLLASFMSAITLLGTPGELYQHGTMYLALILSYPIVIAVSAHVLLPIYYNLELISAYQYLELRFNQVVRLQGTITFIVQMTIYMGIVLYAPALALNAVTGLSWELSVAILGIVCTFYTTIGGMKAVMWTDVFQIFVMFTGMICVLLVGMNKVGGWGAVMDALYATGRFELTTIDPNPNVRHSIWSLMFGGSITWLVIYGANQTQIQRYLTVSSLKKAQIALWLNLPGLAGLAIICGFCGLVAFANYQTCDPITQGRIQKSDQILPLLVMDVLNWPGFPGLFIATIFSGALSTVSSGLNSLAAVLLEDIIKPYCVSCHAKELTEEHGAIVSKVIALAFGVICLGMAFIASQMGDVLQAALGLFGMVGGPLLALFLLGILFPFCNWKGACVGHIFGEIMSLWVGFGAYIYKYPNPPKPFLPPGCNLTEAINATFVNVTSAPFVYEGLEIYRMSYMWQGMFAVACTMSMALLVSLITGKQNGEELDPRLIYPVFDRICCCLPKSVRDILRCGVGKNRPFETRVDTARGHSRLPIVSSTVDKAYSNPVFHSNSLQSDLNKADIHDAHIRKIRNDPTLISYNTTNNGINFF